MPQSLSRLYVHLIFSTKDRQRTIAREVRQPLHAYLATSSTTNGTCGIDRGYDSRLQRWGHLVDHLTWGFATRLV